MTNLPQTEFLKLEKTGSRLTIIFNRPEQRNAINMQMGQEFADTVRWLHENPDDIRLVILRGAGGHFCAGGDIKERKNQVESSMAGEDPIFERNKSAGHAFLNFERLGQTTIAVVEGSAFGGGMGYACLADITIISTTAKMGMPETTLGVAPAQIAPYVVKRIGLTRARQLALTGERFDGRTAYDYGIAQYLSDPENLEQTVEQVVTNILKCGPKANATTKKIMANVGRYEDEQLIERSAKLFAELNRSGEGKEGQTAFAEKRKPAWQDEI